MPDDVLQSDPPPRTRSRGWGRSAALVAGGVLAGAVVAAGLVANAASDGGRDGPSVSRDDDRGHRDEQPLTGETAERVTDVALAEYPGATIRRVETDSDGVYEAHLVTSDGERVTVEVGEDFAVTGVERRGR
ncbi:hypothetical protein ACI782_04590 [Geodermatophilus sp. SYSU D00703]